VANLKFNNNKNKHNSNNNKNNFITFFKQIFTNVIKKTGNRQKILRSVFDISLKLQIIGYTALKREKNKTKKEGGRKH